jgi:hypothetical protein
MNPPRSHVLFSFPASQVMALGLLGAIIGNRNFGPELNNFYRE